MNFFTMYAPAIYCVNEVLKCLKKIRDHREHGYVTSLGKDFKKLFVFSKFTTVFSKIFDKEFDGMVQELG